VKVLISAYACEPGRGSEPEVGFQSVRVASERHAVWVLTRENHMDRLAPAIAELPHAGRIHVVPFDVPGRALEHKHRSLVHLHRYYDVWQREAGKIAVELDAGEDFDVVHHATFAAYWSPAGVAHVDKPFVWGPIGGGVAPPLRLLPELGLKGSVSSLARVVLRPILGVRSRAAAQRAAVILVQNRETQRLVGRWTSAQMLVMPNAIAAVRSAEGGFAGDTPSGQVVAVSRLTPWKAIKLAMRAMREMKGDTRLVVFGEGADRSRLEKTSKRWGLDGRVELAGNVERERLLPEIRRASALLHPALHEEAGFAVAEALSLGTPVVCLDVGGPPSLVALWPPSPSGVVQPSTPQRTARDLARHLERIVSEGWERPSGLLRPTREFADVITESYEHAAQTRRPNTSR
jgi:glycosyltransferase involved in cell wall biosynthesis